MTLKEIHEFLVKSHSGKTSKTEILQMLIVCYQDLRRLKEYKYRDKTGGMGGGSSAEMELMDQEGKL